MTILFHNHHMTPKHMGGTDDPANIVRVNTAMHAFLHKCLYEEHGKWQDLVAWKGLEGSVGKDELKSMASHYANIGKKATSETRKKLSDERIVRWSNSEYRLKMSGRAPWNKGKVGVQVSGNKGKKHPGVGGRKKGSTPWNKGLRYTHDHQ